MRHWIRIPVFSVWASGRFQQRSGSSSGSGTWIFYALLNLYYGSKSNETTAGSERVLPSSTDPGVPNNPGTCLDDTQGWREIPHGNTETVMAIHNSERRGNFPSPHLAILFSGHSFARDEACGEIG